MLTEREGRGAREGFVMKRERHGGQENGKTEEGGNSGGIRVMAAGGGTDFASALVARPRYRRHWHLQWRLRMDAGARW